MFLLKVKLRKACHVFRGLGTGLESAVCSHLWKRGMCDNSRHLQRAQWFAAQQVTLKIYLGFRH